MTVALLALPAVAGGEQPIDALKRTVEDGLRILNDPHYRPLDLKDSQKQKLLEILSWNFDFTEFSRRVLSDKWALFTVRQRMEFIEVFSRFLTEHYLSRLQQHYMGEKVGFRGQEIIAPDRAAVKMHVIWENREFPVEVRMHSRSGRWKTYDVSVLGISAMQIYRAQFQEIMSTQSPLQVINLIRNRLEEK